MMTFRVVHKPSNNHVRCPYRVIEQTTGREIGWINEYLDYETLRRLADATLRTYAHELLHFVRWWESVHHTDAVSKDALTESTLLDYVRFQSSQERELTGATINQREHVAWFGERGVAVTARSHLVEAGPAEHCRQSAHEPAIVNQTVNDCVRAALQGIEISCRDRRARIIAIEDR